jgi:hypothetical protein
MALRMDEADALPRMALVASFGLAALAVAHGTGLGTAFVQFLIMTLFLPVVALAITGLPLMIIRRTAYLRLAASWLLLLAGLAALAIVAFGVVGAPDVAAAAH